MPNTITDSELREVRTITEQIDRLTQKVANLEVAKLAAAADLLKKMEANDKLMTRLRDVYGKIDIDLETGEFTKIEEDGVQ